MTYTSSDYHHSPATVFILNAHAHFNTKMNTCPSDATAAVGIALFIIGLYDDTDEEMNKKTELALAMATDGERIRNGRQRGKSNLTRADLLSLSEKQHHGKQYTPQEMTERSSSRLGSIFTGLRHSCSRFRESSRVVIPRRDVNVNERCRLGRLSLSAAAALGLMPHYLNSTMSEITLQQIFRVTAAVCSHYMRFGLRILPQVLKIIPQAAIEWPNHSDQFRDFAARIFERHPLINGGCCFVDGLNILMAKSRDEDVQNAHYNGWTCSHYCSSVLAFAPDLCLIYCALSAPDSWHDVAVARKLYVKLLDNTPKGFFAIADTAFPKNHVLLNSLIMTPLKKNSKAPRLLQQVGRMDDFEAMMTKNAQLVSARQVAEWDMRSLQGSFSQLKMPLPADDSEFRAVVLETCARLHQVRTRVVEINQIRAVYEVVWREGRSTIYEDFERMLFKDMKANDHIARFSC